MTRGTGLLVALALLCLATAVYAGDVIYSPPSNYTYPPVNTADYRSPHEKSSYAYYLNQKLYGDFAHIYPPTVYPYLLCVEALDASTKEAYDYDAKSKQSGGYDDEYGGSDYKKPKILWRAHFGYYSSYKKPYANRHINNCNTITSCTRFLGYKVCTKCSTGRSYDGYEFHTEKGPTEFVSGYSTHFPSSAYHVDFKDGKNNYASWQVKHLTALASRKSQRCPTYKYSRLLYGKAPDIDIPYLKSAYSVNGPWTDNSPFNSKGEGDSRYRDSGYTYFGQFVDHDLTKDPVPGSAMYELYTSDSRKYIRKPDWYQWDPYTIRNGRTPHLDLDSVYGKYGRDMRYRDYEDPAKLAKGDGHDIPRHRGNCTAKVTEMRNSENSLVSQFHYLFIEVHNTVVDNIREHDRKSGCKSVAVFERAKRIVQWHYQWLVLNVFLPKIVDHDILDHIHTFGRRHWVGSDAQGLHIPIEFSAAAYRLHSLVRPGYLINDKVGWKKLFDTEHFGSGNDLLGNQCLEKKNLVMDWRRFFTFDCEPFRAVPGKLIDADVARPLLNLPHPPTAGWVVDADPMSLPMRSILRGSMYGIPSGEAYARAFHVRPLTHKQVDWYVDGYYRRDGDYSSNYKGESKGYGHDDKPSKNDDYRSGPSKRSNEGYDKNYDDSYDKKNNYDDSYDKKGKYDDSYGKKGKYDDSYGKKGSYDDKKHRYDDYDPYDNYDGTPLWFYIQQEAKLHNKGERLGYVGSLIVAETILGVLQADPDSYLNSAPGFKPFLYGDSYDKHDSYRYGKGESYGKDDDSYGKHDTYDKEDSNGSKGRGGYGKRDEPKEADYGSDGVKGRPGSIEDRGKPTDKDSSEHGTYQTTSYGQEKPANSQDKPTNSDGKGKPDSYDKDDKNGKGKPDSYDKDDKNGKGKPDSYDKDDKNGKGKDDSYDKSYGKDGYCSGKRSSYYKIQDLLDFVGLRKPEEERKKA